MSTGKKIIAISGSTRSGSVNLHILTAIAEMYKDVLDIEIYNEIDQLPHFNPDLDKEPFPPAVASFRNKIESSDGVIICTPEYVYSLPGSLKNAVEWTVSTTVFTNKPTALITAASSGEKAHEALNLLMRTIGVSLAENGSLLITAPKTKLNTNGEITDPATRTAIRQLINDFIDLLDQK